MVVLNRIYTKTGDKGETALGSGERVAKTHPRIAAYGTVDETNAVLGLVRLHSTELAPLDAMLARIQNDLFDLGADLCVPETGKDLGYTPLRMTMAQAERVEREIDELNAELQPLRSFVLPGGHPAAAYLHLARTVCRRAERLMVALKNEPGEVVSESALVFVNRLSDFLFVASRWVNARADGDRLWVKGEESLMFVPLHDDNSLRVIRIQGVTIGLILANIAVFLLTAAPMNEAQVIYLAAGYGIVPAELTYTYGDAYSPIPEPATLVTYQFLHGGWLHLLSNMLFLWVFADNVEDAYGHMGFLLFYLLTGAAGALTHVLVEPTSLNPLIGASGAVSGVLAAYLVLYPRARIWVIALIPIPFRLSAMWVLGGWFAVQLYNVLTAQGEKLEVAWWAHIGGFLAGLALTGILRSRLLPQPAR